VILGVTLTASLGGLLFGYDTAVISGAVSSIDVNFVEPMHLDETARNSLSGLTVSSALFGCVIGAIAAGWIATTFGRRRGMMAAAWLFLIGSIGSAVPELGLGPIGGMGAAALVPFNVYRVLGGIGVGIASMLCPMYIAEIAPRETRGRLVTCYQMAIVIGIIVVYFVNYLIAQLGDEAWVHARGWRWMLASEAVPAALFGALLLGVPESPRWLVARGRTDEALRVLRTTSPEPAASATLAEIRDSLVVATRPLLSFGWGVLVIGVSLSVFQQLVGINAVLYYAPRMFENMGASSNAALLQTVVVGAANMAFTVLALYWVDRHGRRPLLIAGSLMMAAAMCALGALFGRQSVGLGALVAVVAYTASFAFSWGPVVWVLLAELFPNSIKGRAMGTAVAAQWIANVLVSWSFRVLDGSSFLNAYFHHGFAYWVYGAMALLSAGFVWRWVPETKGHSLEAIQRFWPSRSGSSAG